ncbi:MAG: hypothetical protein HY928_01455 [Elusimicrobia bacterium]|nr:hypothetical protein [Elusimicrobiota bacterium]
MKRTLLLVSFAAVLSGCAALRAREPNLAMPTDPMYMSEHCRELMDECMGDINDQAQCKRSTGC